MKKQVIFILCCIFALSSVNVMANSSKAAKKSAPVISYAINLGDVSELSEEVLNEFIDNTFSVIPTISDAKEAMCSITVTVTGKAAPGGIGIEISVSVTVTAPCSEASAVAKKVAKEVKQTVQSLI